MVSFLVFTSVVVKLSLRQTLCVNTELSVRGMGGIEQTLMGGDLLSIALPLYSWYRSSFVAEPRFRDSCEG